MSTPEAEETSRTVEDVLHLLGVPEGDLQRNGNAPAGSSEQQDPAATDEHGVAEGKDRAVAQPEGTGDDAAGEGAGAGEPEPPKDQETSGRQAAPPEPPTAGQFEEYAQLARARERLNKLEAEAELLGAFEEWAEQHPEGGRCVLHGREVGEFDEASLRRAVETVRRRLMGVEVDRRLASERVETLQSAVMNRTMAAAKAVAPGLFISGHAQQAAAKAILAALPAPVRRAVEGDPLSNLLLALAVRGLEGLRPARNSARPAPTRSVTPTGTSGGGDVEVERERLDRRKLVERLIEGRGNVSELAALLR